jgi:N-acetylglucosaminyl-diphospho-decaprenol L-rhamnosyltransferase
MSGAADAGTAGTLSVLTPVRGRLDHLAKLLDGLDRATAHGPPFELLVGWMGGADPRSLLSAERRFEARAIAVDGKELPLARARNELADAAAGERLVFLDVDCIPATNLLSAYASALASADVLALGEVRYLPAGAYDGRADDAALLAAAEPHSERAELFPAAGDIAVDERHELFWSLSFAVRRATFRERIGGFDEGYRGYGIEDTDFGMRAARAGAPLAWVGGALAFHQHHPPTRMRPDGIPDLVRNARRYRELWGSWPAPGWFDELAAAGLVRWDAGADLLVPASP